MAPGLPLLVHNLASPCLGYEPKAKVATPALGLQPQQRLAKVRAKSEAQESHFMLPGVWKYGRV